MEQQIPDFMREDKVDLSSMASDDKLRRASEMAQQYVAIIEQIRELETVTLPALKKQRDELARRQIPDFFDGISTDKVGVPDAGVDVVVQPFVHANIKSDWPEEQRQEAFRYLEQLGLGDIIAIQLVVKFSRGEIEKAREMEVVIRQSRHGNTNPPHVEESTPWNTLTASIKAELEKGTSLDLEKLGATVGRTAAIKKRKK